MIRLARGMASRMLAAASRLVPNHLSPWVGAMDRELAEIEDDRAALAFAAGCLRAVLGLAIAVRLRSTGAAARYIFSLSRSSTWSPTAMTDISTRPRLLGLICGACAVGIGIAYMLAAGAPPRYLIVNLAALLIGASAWLALGRTARGGLAGAGPAILAMAVILLSTSLFGVAVDGASRWISIGTLNLQVSLIVVPVMVILYSRRADRIGTAGMIAAALALALQPDRAMAGALLAGLVGLVLARPSRLAIAAIAASILAFGSTLLAPEGLAAMPFVDRILYTAFDVHPLAGSAVAIGALALIVPASIGASSGAGERPALFAFGGCWLAMVVAAALGNYPTPLVGYGGSAVLGYLLSVALLPNGAREAKSRGAVEARPIARGSDQDRPELSVPHPA
jgi:hypothetical protein